MGKGASGRTRSRRTALKVLFEMDINRSSLREVVSGKMLVGEDTPEGFALELITGVGMNRDWIDSLISQYSEGWDISRMPRVDRVILQVAVFELFFLEDVPPGATIDEAVELAKTYSTADSGRFINGMLGKLNSDREAGTITLPSA